MAAALARQVPITEYEPRKIKQAITGNGAAAKEQVCEMLVRILNIPRESLLPKLDATDALAAALCHFYESDKPVVAKGAKSWKEYIAKRLRGYNYIQQSADMENSEIERIHRLRDELHRHNYNYYVANSPEIDDREFDMLMKELEELEKRHPEEYDPNSPTQRVGSDLNTGFEQAAHIYPMLSLANTYSIDEVDAWFHRVEDALVGQESTIVGEMKFDGLGISLIYEHGRLVRAVTRGDGEKGDVVTDNIKTIRSIPLQLQGSGWPDFFEIRGEVLLPFEAFRRLNQQREEAGETPFANPRNAAITF